MSPGVIVVSFESLPSSEQAVASGAVGAIINVFVSGHTVSRAIEIAHQEVGIAGWKVVNTESITEVTRKSYEEDDSGLAYYEQSLLDGVVLVIHTWKEGN